MSDQSPLALWEASANSPFIPAVGKDAQLLVGFVLLSIGFVLTALFGLSMLLHEFFVSHFTSLPFLASPRPKSPYRHACIQTNANCCIDLSVKNLPVLAVPASLAFAFGAVYMICAVGVYV